ncbi:MAG TPA: sigma-54 dependent transcriptional regulator [Vicinamibacterales bacterium]|jgi:two-component system nitrogen regulation response regulator NtrX|nr:sigma-54 dependent transcriptional regulator [Vicinamibacterales bacterium]
MTTQVLVVDDVPAMAEQYAYDLKRVGGYHTLVAAGGDQAFDVLAREPIDCVILDLEMPGLDGFEVLRRLQQRGVDTPVIVYTGTGSYDRCVQAVRLGAYGFVDKAEPIERVVQEIENAVSRGRLVKELRTLRSRFDGETLLIGDSPAMRSLRDAIARIAPIPSGVLIVGESGTGKELVARELHRRGPGEKAPLVAVNSAALPEQLVESELFGHERGAFTGADRLRRGAFENAGGGTLFLDEVGELPLPAQAKLLRVLEERKVTRVGGDRPIAVSARVVAATNRDLEHEVEAGRFRQDLYYRLNVHTLRVPALRERLSDVPALVEHLLRSLASHLGVRSKTIAPDALALLAGADWRRNNVRELRNCLERMMIASDAPVISAAEVPPEIRGDERDDANDAAPGSLKALKTQAERQILLAALEQHEWHVTRTAEALGLADHSSLLKIMRRHGLSKGTRRDP